MIHGMSGSHDVFLAETIARHFDGSTVDGTTARLGVDGIEIACEVHDVSQLDDH